MVDHRLETRLFRQTLYNLGGLGLPLIAAIVTIPPLIESLGVERFGMLALIWALVSYFGVFDLGLGRALTQEMAEMRARGNADQARYLAGTAVGGLALLGIFAGLLLALGAPWLVARISGVSDPEEAVRAVYALALSVPFVVLTAGLRGVLEAQDSFGVVNGIRLPTGLYTFIAPLAVVYYWSDDLGTVALCLAAGRVVAFGVHAWYCRHAINGWFPIEHDLLSRLLRSGGWMTVSNVLGPLMVYLDRCVIGATISVAAVAYYATPYEIVTKLWIIPGALTAVLFPRFAQVAVLDARLGRDLFRRAVAIVFVGIYPLVLGVALFSDELLRAWVGAEFGARSAGLLQVFAVGILVSSLAHLPFAFLQATGRADLVARIHVIEFPFFALLLWFLSQNYGLPGAAFAWLIRTVIDALLLFFVAHGRMGASPRRNGDMRLALVAIFTAASFLGVYVPDPVLRVPVWGLSIAVNCWLCWRLLLMQEDRTVVLQRLFHVSA